ncbi:MAG: cytochrome c biogenesis protein CcsA [Planctomycetes bacterium]|nr:cytochrome c biogenesis protein CcsA [Planctomycetota bacterium]
MRFSFGVLLLLFSAVLVPAGVWWALTVAPDIEGMTFLQRLVYFHVPSALLAYVLFTIAAACGLLYLWSGDGAWDAGMVAGIETGLLALSVVIVTGAVWARNEWGRWWVWDDPQLTSTAVLWFAYVAVLVVRACVITPGDAVRLTAVLSLVGVLFCFLARAIYFLGQEQVLHPVTVPMGRAQGSDPGAVADLRAAKTIGWLACAAVYFALFLLRRRVARAEQTVGRIEARLEAA